MQAITIAIGKTGIRFFAQHYLLDTLQQLLGQLKPPDRTIHIADFFNQNDGHQISNMKINLSEGHLVDYSPVFQQVVQGLSDQKPVFTLTLGSSQFSAGFEWHETYHAHWSVVIYGRRVVYNKNRDHTYAYNPSFTQLLVTVPMVFLFDNNAWEIKVQESSGQSQGAQANIPPGSPLNGEEHSGCSYPHIAAATAQMIGDIDFAKAIEPVIQRVIASIPGSGNLGDNIVYDFSLSDPAGLAFPNNDGIQMGVKGGASYNGTAFPGAPPADLPLPAPLADDDTHHLNMYVSNYEVDALNWAYWKAGKLTTTVTPAELGDPDILKVKTYVPYCAALKPYAGRAMNAKIEPNAAPVTTFQLVYELSTPVMAELKKQLPKPVYDNLYGLDGNYYTAKADLESDLKVNGIGSTYYEAIEKAAESMGMVVTHDINFTLIIQDFQPTEPTIVFNVKRTDILSDLALGLSGDDKPVQTLQFQFVNVVSTATFISSSIPKLNGEALHTIWINAGEKQYDDLLQTMGKKGTPVPIMADLQFDFENAVLSIQENYVSILASVLYKKS